MNRSWLRNIIIYGQAGLDIQEKTLGPAGLQAFRFSRKQNYLSEKLVASGKNLITLVALVVATPSSVEQI